MTTINAERGHGLNEQSALVEVSVMEIGQVAM